MENKDIVINHLTMNTGHMMEITKDSVNKDMLFTMRRIRKNALTDQGAEILDGTIFKLTEEGDAYIGTLFAGDIPLLSTGGSKSKNMYLWENLVNQYKTFTGDEILRTPPGAPYACDILYPMIIIKKEILTWTGDFCRCVAWIELMQ